jgi:ATP phosphoribosyltransferase
MVVGKTDPRYLDDKKSLFYYKFDIADTTGKVEVCLWKEVADEYHKSINTGSVLRLKGLNLKIGTFPKNENRWVLQPISAREFSIQICKYITFYLTIH